MLLAGPGLLVVLSPAEARAQVIEGGVPVQTRHLLEERRFAARPLVLEARLGTGTIVGAIGVTASYSPWSFLSFGAGAGANLAGGQFAGFVAVRPITFLSKRWSRLHAIGVELGYSTGPFTDSIGESYYAYSWDRVHWFQPLLFYQTQSYRGVNLLAGIGAAIPFAETGYHCHDVVACGGSGPSIHGLTTVTAGLGYAWDGR